MIDQLERQLLALSRRLDVDVDDRMVDDVLRRLGSERAPSTRVITPRRLTLAGLALAASLVTVVAIPDSRDVVANWFGIGSTRIEPTPTTVTTGPSTGSSNQTTPETSTAPDAATTTLAAQFPTELDLGQPVSAVEAGELTGLPVPVATQLGEPSGVFVLRPPDSGQIVVVYPASPLLPASPVAGVGALLSTVSGRLDEGLFLKVAEPGTTVESLSIAVASGAIVPAIWLSGEPHTYAVQDSEGKVLFDTLRLATNTLLWMERGVVLRLEAQVTRQQAIDIAATVVESE